ncbi:site-specific integrase [Vibrio parahaemolyticus]|nr:site-specific integrase [Vibrio parahaemolyticus]
MIEQSESFPEDFGIDYCVMSINTNKYPSYISRPDSEGEIIHEVRENSKSFIHTIPILIDPDGNNVVPVNLYLHSLLFDPDVSSVKTIESHANALLSFYRWMSMEIPAHIHPRTGAVVEEKLPLTIYDCTEKVEESPVVRYRDYLSENLYTVDENGKIGGSPSSASNYVLRVVAYYSFLHRQRIVPLSKTFRPFDYKTKRVRKKNKKKSAQHDMLSHLNPYGNNEIIVYTTGLTKPFKNKEKPQDADIRELRPLREDEKQAFYQYIDVENSTDTKDLMLYLKTETGLRVEELITFPESIVDKPKSKVIKVQIGEEVNGCITKYRKVRTIEIPDYVMDLLYEYKLSKARTLAIQSGLLRHGRLFVKSNGDIYATNTIQKYVEDIRNNLIMKGLNIYFSAHDLRATFATDWLYDKHMKTGKPFEALLSELAKLMGHDKTTTTQKYVNYMNDDKTWSEFAQRKNQYAHQALR